MVDIWTQKEIDFLKQSYGKITSLEISKNIHRTSSSIRAKASSLNLKSFLDHSPQQVIKMSKKLMLELKNTAYIPSKNLFYILGVLNGDGYISKDFFRLAVKDKEFADYCEKKIEEWSGLNVCRYIRKDKYFKQGFYYELRFNSKKAVEFLDKFYITKFQNKAIENIRKFANTENKKDYYTEFIKGFFDSEGYFSGNKIGFSNTNYYLITLIKEFLDYLDINSHIYTSKSRKNKLRNITFI